jgi:SsrA-binding protein
MGEDLVSNRKAFHNYEILENLEAGIQLLGTEVKSLREHGGNLQDAYVALHLGEAWLKNCSISPYKFGNIYNHEEKRERKLLLHKREIARLKSLVEEKGYTVVPLSMYFSKGHIKVRIAVARGKKAYDKRASIKARDAKRDIDRAMKSRD